MKFARRILYAAVVVSLARLDMVVAVELIIVGLINVLLFIFVFMAKKALVLESIFLEIVFNNFEYFILSTIDQSSLFAVFR